MRAPTSPPISAAKISSYDQSGSSPNSRSRRATSPPARRNATAKQIPKVCSVMGPRSSSGCTAPEAIRLQVAHRVDRRPVDARLEVHVRAGAVARVARLGDHLALLDALALRYAERRVVGVASRQSAAV